MRYPENILRNVLNPIQYVGKEYNMVKKDTDGKLRLCLSFPDLYSIGMSSYGHRLLYSLFNSRDNIYAERVYAVEKDMEKQLRDNAFSILSLETGTPLKDFDIIGFTLEYELTFTNMLQILDLAGIPILSEKRTEDDPIIIAGGTAVFNPLPVRDFVDVFFVGDGETMINDIAEIAMKRKNGEISRGEALQYFDELQYTFVPQGTGTEKDVQQSIMEKLSNSSEMSRPLVPNTKIVHDRIVAEISRGCTRGCRFCQAGMIYRPVRQDDPDEIIKGAMKRLKSTGYREISLLSLSATDYTDIKYLLKTMSKEASKYKASISLPSLRIGDIDEDLYEQVSSVRKSGITVAIETVSEKLKKVINKDISHEEIIETIETGLRFGWKHFKLYFMIGLPFEEDEDVLAIADFLNDIGSKYRSIVFNVSISPFVPRPFTPFQWVEQISRDEIKRRTELIVTNLNRRNVDVNYRDYNRSFLEGVFARGDSKLNELIKRAYDNGARLDEWSEYFDFSIWEQSAEQENIDLNSFLRSYKADEALPWDFIHTAVSRSFLEREYLAAEKGKMTEDCRSGKCTNCDACDGSIAGEKKHVREHNTDETQFARRKKKKIINRTQQRTKIFLLYEIDRDFQYMSHLGIINLISSGLRRTEIDFVYTQGFNPKLKLVYGPPKPVYAYSKMEMLEIYTESRPDENLLEQLNEAFPDGINFYFMKELPIDRMSVISKMNRMNMVFATEPDEPMKERIENFLKAEEYIIERQRQNKPPQNVDIRQYVDNIETKEGKINVILKYNMDGSIKFEEIYRHILGLEDLGEIEVYRERFFRDEDGSILGPEEV